MKKVIRLTEQDLINIVKNVLNEQWWLSVGEFAAHEANTGSGWDIGFGTQDTRLMRDLSGRERFKMLFDWAKSWPSTASDWNSIKPYALAMKEEMTGLGSGNVLSYLPKFNTKGKFAALCKNFKFDGLDLYGWFSGEQTIGWDSILNSIPSAVKKGLPTKAPKTFSNYA